MDDKHHPLGFKQHPLEDAGIYIYILYIYIEFMKHKNYSTNKKLNLGAPKFWVRASLKKAKRRSLKRRASRVKCRSLTQEVPRPNGLPLGRIGNPERMDHPKDQPLCLVDWTSRAFFFGSIKLVKLNESYLH